MVYILVGTLVYLAICFVVHRWLRGRALATEHADDPTPERVHRLQKLAMWQGLVQLALILLAVGGLTAAGHAEKHSSTATKVVLLVAYCVLVVAAVLTVRGTVRPSLARVRDVPVKPAGRRRMLAVLLPVVFVLGALLGLAFAFAPKHGAGRAVTLVVAYLLVFVVLQSLLAPLMVRAVRSRPLPDATGRRLQELAHRMGVRCEVRAFEGREQKIANAVQVGTIPRLRFVMVSDYLLDGLDDDEVDAVVAHEFGHLRGHHVLLRLLTVAAVWGVLETLVVVVRGSTGHGGAALLALPILVALPIGVLLANGLMGVRLEKRADDTAARAVGADELASALARISELNHTKRDTGRVWSVLTQHPGVDERIARLRQHSRPRPTPAGSGAAASPR